MYTININDPEQRTVGNVRKMIASGDDRRHSQIRLSYDGRLYVAHVEWGEDRLDGVLFRSWTYAAGEGRVGTEAAEDTDYARGVCEGLKKLREAYENLKTDWPKPVDYLLYDAEEPYALYPQMLDDYLGPYANWTRLAEGYGGLKRYFEYPPPDESGVVYLTKRKIHIF
jgi:hypothetical protein